MSSRSGECSGSSVRIPRTTRSCPSVRWPTCHFGRVLFLPATRDLEGETIGRSLVADGRLRRTGRTLLESLVDARRIGARSALRALRGLPCGAHSLRASELLAPKLPRHRRQLRALARAGPWSRFAVRPSFTPHFALTSIASTARGVPALEVRRRLLAFVASEPVVELGAPSRRWAVARLSTAQGDATPSRIRWGFSRFSPRGGAGAGAPGRARAAPGEARSLGRRPSEPRARPRAQRARGRGRAQRLHGGWLREAGARAARRDS